MKNLFRAIYLVCLVQNKGIVELDADCEMHTGKSLTQWTTANLQDSKVSQLRNLIDWLKVKIGKVAVLLPQANASNENQTWLFSASEIGLEFILEPATQKMKDHAQQSADKI